MAERFAIASGNWSNAAIWDGGTLPAVDDDVHANGFTIEINVDITVVSVRTDAGSTAAAGGRFNVQGGNTATANSQAGSSLALFVGSGGIQNGNSTGGSAPGANGSLIQTGGIQNGNSTGGSVSNASGSIVQFGGIQNGNSTGGLASFANGSLIQTGGIQNGNSTGGSALAANGSFVHTGGVLVLSGVTDTAAATAVRVSHDATVIFADPSLSESDLDIQTTRFTIGNVNHPFINPPSTGGTAGPTNVFISGVFG